MQNVRIQSREISKKPLYEDNRKRKAETYMKKIICIAITAILLLTMITPAFALPNVQENANSDDAYSFDVTIDGLHVTRAVIVENGIPRQLTEAEYVALMQASANEETICSSPASNNSNKVPEGETRGWTFTFSPTSHSDALDYSLTKRVSPIYQNATSVSVTATSSFERMVTNSGGLTFTTQVKSVVDATVEAQYSYAVSASSSTSSSVTGTFTPSGNKPYCAVLFTPHIATISGVVTETLSAMGSGSTTTYNCTLKYPVSVNHFLDGLYRLSESNNSEGFPPAA